MRWIFLTLVMLAAAEEPGGSLDPVFANIPFDRWSEKDQDAHFRWTTEISRPALSQHQRLAITIKIQVDGSELLKREGQGKLLVLIQLRDQAGRTYQIHNSLSLEGINPDAGRTESVYTQDAFVIPGDYKISMGWFIEKTGEHAIVRRPLHVDALSHDPLGEAWRDLPAVEFLPAETPPDSWFLPSVKGRLNLQIETKRAVSIEVLVNGSSTEQMPPTHLPGVTRIGPGLLIPAAKALSQIKPSNGASRIAMIDLERRRVAFEQTLERDLDWSGLKAALAEADPNKIDVAALKNRQKNAQFFLSEVQRRLLEGEDSKPLQVLIVLSGLMAFDKAEVSPIRVVENPNWRVFYIRFHPTMGFPSRTPPFFPEDRGRRGGLNRGRGPIEPRLAQSDGLFDLVKPLHPTLFDVTTAIEVRKALGTVMSEIGRMGNR